MKRKHFYSVREYAEERHFEPRHVRRLCVEGKVSAYKEGRNWVILGDQTKKATVSWCYTPSGTKVPVPPIPPDGLIWDMVKGRFVPREKYARDKGYRLVTSNGKKLIDPTSSPKFREELAKLVRESLQHSQVATLDSGERILVLL